MSRHRLVVLACSASKRPDPGRIPASDRYDGPLWRTLRSADPKGRRAKVAFLSARFGFRDADTPIENCDARLTEDLAERMVAGGMTTRWPRPPSPRKPDSYGMHPGHEIASLTRYGAEPIDDIALVSGHLCADLAVPGQLAGLHGQLARGVHHVAGPYGRHVGRQWRNNFRQF